jgi:hypothetical protein
VASVLSFWCRSVAFRGIPLLVKIKVLGLLVVVQIHLIWLDLSNMVVLGDWGC